MKTASVVTAVVENLGGIADPYTLTELGFRVRQIEAAVRRGELQWCHDGRVEVIGVESGARSAQAAREAAKRDERQSVAYRAAIDALTKAAELSK
jgi:hypothetical protein